MGAYIPTFGDRAPDAKRVAKGNGTNGKDPTLYFASRITHSLRTKTVWMGTVPVRGLSSPEPNHNPKQIPTAVNAGTTREGQRSKMVHQDGPKKQFPPHQGQGRG